MTAQRPARASDRRRRTIERVQTGVRMEKRIYQTLKAFAALREALALDLTAADSHLLVEAKSASR